LCLITPLHLLKQAVREQTLSPQLLTRPSMGGDSETMSWWVRVACIAGGGHPCTP